MADDLPGVEIYAKAEFFNPGGSVKDRAGLNMIVEGEQLALVMDMVAFIVDDERRNSARRNAHAAGAWVREAASAYAAKHSATA